MSAKTSTASEKGHFPAWLTMFLLLALVMTALLGGAFLPGRTLFSNDGPLGRLVSDCHKLPQAFSGVWEDLNSLGYREQGALPSITYGFRLLVGPLLFSKYYVALALTILGLGTWCFFRQMKLATAACILGGLAAALNSDFFSTACWGVASHPLTVGMTFFAMAALVKTASWRGWLQAVLAGAAVGMGLAEGADVGAIFSVYVAAFAMYQAWIAEGPRLKNLVVGAARVMVVAGFAAFVAAQAIFALVNTQIEGVAGMEQDVQTKEQHWQWATRWSLPKKEALGLIVPGLFGYRLDTPNGGGYWGAQGRSPTWDAWLANGEQGQHPRDMLRQTGSGFYAGVTVILVAIWAIVQSFRREESVFNATKRKWIWFWIGIGLISLLLGFGKNAPFYRIIYSLPYFSTIRNPVKFIAVLNFSLVVLFAYGVDGLWRVYLETPNAGAPKRSPATIRFDKLWLQGLLVAIGLSVVGWLIYANSAESLRTYLEREQFLPEKARSIASFSIAQVGWFLLFLILCAGAMGLIITGHLAGARAKWGAILLGTVLVFDLGRADQAWIITWDYHDKYASNPIIDMLRQKPYEHRVAIVPARGPTGKPTLDQLYTFGWAQQEFQFYDIQSLDVVQLPRIPEDIAEWRRATVFNGTTNTASQLIRRWELSNTRYLLGTTEFLPTMINELDPGHGERFQILSRFNLAPKRSGQTAVSDLTAVTSPDGEYALYEFTGALPRAALFSAWEVNTNSKATLAAMMVPAFDVNSKVFVAGGLPASATGASTNENAGTVDYVSYASKDIVLNAKAAKPGVLLLNDRYDPNWKVWVDGNPAPLLKCNFMMRGVYLEPGTHKVEFRFVPPVDALYVSVTAMGISVMLVGVLIATKRRVKSQPIAPGVATATHNGNASNVAVASATPSKVASPVKTEQPAKPAVAPKTPASKPKQKQPASKARR